MLSVGLTGNIASGKSTVARLLAEHHSVPVIDADQVARAVVEPGTPGLAAIEARFGPGVIDADGRLDRDALGAIIRADADARRELEALTHPAIYAAIDAWLQQQRGAGATIAVVEAALIVETGQQDRYDRLLVVSCSPERQIQRVMARNGIPRADAEAWLGTQLPAAAKERVADRVIRNDGDLADLEREVGEAVAWLAGEAAGAPG